MRRVGVAVAAATLGVVTGSLVNGATPATGVGIPADELPDVRTVAEISGTIRTGFDLRYANGERVHTPTLSEAITECYAYQRARQRRDCVLVTRTHYRSLATLRRSVRWAER